MDSEIRKEVSVLWEYMGMHQKPRKADLILGFGCYYEEIARRCAELYSENLAPKILFTGGLGRNTRKMWDRPEAERFAAAAIREGVPEENILLETKSSNTGENLLFTREMVKNLGIRSILGVHKPCMERRVAAAMGVYWPEMNFTVTSPQVTIEEFVQQSFQYGINEHRVISILVGDYQRVLVYGEKGYQLPQSFCPEADRAFRILSAMGYTEDLVKE